MAKKSVTVRLNEDVIELVNQQAGDTFTQKFENLITRCVWELPQIEKQLKEYRQKVKREQAQLSKISQQVYEYRAIVQRLDGQLGTLAKLIDASTKERTV